MGEIKINYAAVAEAEQKLHALAASISGEINVPLQNSKGEFVQEMQETVANINQFRTQLVEVINKTASALNNTIVSFKKADEGMSYRG